MEACGPFAHRHVDIFFLYVWFCALFLPSLHFSHIHANRRGDFSNGCFYLEGFLIHICYLNTFFVFYSPFSSSSFVDPILLFVFLLCWFLFLHLVLVFFCFTLAFKFGQDTSGFLVCSRCQTEVHNRIWSLPFHFLFPIRPSNTHSHTQTHTLDVPGGGWGFGMCWEWAPNCFLLIQIAHQKQQHFSGPPKRSARLGLFITPLTPQLDPSYAHILHAHLHPFTYPGSLSLGFNWSDVLHCEQAQWRWRAPLWGWMRAGVFIRWVSE